MERAQARLRDECARSGQADRYEALFGNSDGGVPNGGRAEAAARLGLTENALNLTARRFRERFETIIREEVAQTVSTPAEVDEEIRYLLEVLTA
jgi:hypothetical protein